MERWFEQSNIVSIWDLGKLTLAMLIGLLDFRLKPMSGDDKTTPC